MRPTTLGLAACLVLAGCTVDVALPTHVGGGGPDSLIVATIRGDPATGCVWLEGADGSHRTTVVWPPGFRARFSPLTLVAPDGKEFAREGDQLAVGGADFRHPAADRCGTPSAWFGTEVVEVNGRAVRIPPPLPAPPRVDDPVIR